MRSVLFIFLFCISTLSRSQSVYRFRNYTINDGLSQSSVSCIIQDNNNALWIGTQDGLNRFDGRSFEVFSSDDTPGLESEHIKSSLKTSDGRLWFGTANGLTVFDPRNERFKTYSPSDKIALQIEKITLDSEGLIWLATTGRGVLCFNPVTTKFTSYHSLIPSKKIVLVYAAKDNTIFVSTEDKGVFRINSTKKSANVLSIPSESKGAMNVLRIVQCEENKILIGTNQGIFQYSLLTEKCRTAFPAINKRFGAISVSDIYKASSNYWFIGTTNIGLISITPDGNISNNVQDLFQKHALLFNDINTLFRDVRGTFWIGTERGLSSFNPTNQGILGMGPSANLQKGIPSPNVWSFAEDKNAKHVFIGTDDGLSRYDRSTGKFEQYYREQTNKTSAEILEKAVHAIEVLNENHVYVGCSDGFFELKIKGPRNYKYEQLPFLKDIAFIKQKRIYCIFRQKEDEYFLGTKAGVLYINLKTKKTQVFEHNSKMPNQSITPGACRFIFKDKQKRVWFATSSGELSLLSVRQKELKIIPYPYNSVLLKNSKDYISSMCQVSPNEFWLGSLGSGLLYYNLKNKRVKIYNKKEGLPNNVIYCVLPGKDGKLWMSTNKGLSRFDPVTKSFSNFTEKDGLMSNEFNLGAHLVSGTGELFFGGIYGYNYFDPRQLADNVSQINVSITKFKLDKHWLKPNEKGSPLSRPISLTNQIELGYKQRSFTVRFQPSDLSNPDQVNYKYILAGSDEGEFFLGSTNEIHFNSLSSGQYVLYIYGRMAEGPWGTPAKLAIHVRPPYWASWWFITLGIVFGTVLVIWVIRKRIEFERREQVRLEMKIARRTREIRAQNEKIKTQKKQLEEEKTKVEEQQRLLQIEKDKTEKLLKNIIPAETVEELKNKGKASARAYKVVSVLFTDFVGFTKIAEHMDPTELVNRLDVYFRKFDEIILSNNLEKIKTIGDAYMCAGGVPVRNNTNPIDTCLAAL